MAYRFFSKTHQSNKASTTSTPPLQSPYNARHNRLPLQPPPPVHPLSSASTASSAASPTAKPPASAGDTAVQPTPYPHPIPSGYPTPHPHISVETVSTVHIPSLTRITGLLLPTRYPNSFYTATITDPVIASLSRVAIYHDHPVAATPASTSSVSSSSSNNNNNNNNAPGSSLTPGGRNTGTDKVIGGIRCRLERVPQTASGLLQSHRNSGQQPTNLYIQTLHLLSPYRGNGVAMSLLNSLLFDDPLERGSGYRVSKLAKHYNICSITAHVHEANDEGLEWYIARGFQVQEGVIENYYRRLKPSGARIVKLILQWNNDDENDNETIVSQKKDEQPTDQNEKGPYDGDDEDWEKVEAEDEDEDEQEDHGVRPFMGSKIIESDEGGTRKRKADDEPVR